MDTSHSSNSSSLLCLRLVFSVALVLAPCTVHSWPSVWSVLDQQSLQPGYCSQSILYLFINKINWIFEQAVAACVTTSKNHISSGKRANKWTKIEKFIYGERKKMSIRSEKETKKQHISACICLLFGDNYYRVHMIAALYDEVRYFYDSHRFGTAFRNECFKSTNDTALNRDFQIILENFPYHWPWSLFFPRFRPRHPFHSIFMSNSFHSIKSAT